MNKLIYIIIIAIGFIACSKDPVPENKAQKRPLVFAPSFGQTRLACNYSLDDYFLLTEDFGSISLKGPHGISRYSYSEGILSPAGEEDTIVFPDDDAVLEGDYELTWPYDGNKFPAGAVLKDQSERENFLGMDMLKGQICNIVPSELVPVRLYHTRSKITFSLGGTDNGQKIESLEIAGFKAYCDPESKDAQLMYDIVHDAGSLPKGTTGNVTIEGKEGQVTFVLIDSVDEHLFIAGENYTLMLNL